MRVEDGDVLFSATDLANHLACRHLTTLDLQLALGERAYPRGGHRADLTVLEQRGLEHERRYLDGLRAQGLTVVELLDGPFAESAQRTIDEMRRGTGAIAQGALSGESA